MKYIATVLSAVFLSATGAQAQCLSDVKTCPDGQTLNRDSITCKFPLCQGEKDCTTASSGSEENYALCPFKGGGGTTKVYRDAYNNCEFELCDADYKCVDDTVQQCPAPYLHVYVKRDPTAGEGGCQAYLPCPGSGTPEQLPTSTAADPATTAETPVTTMATGEAEDDKDADDLPFSGSCQKTGEAMSWDDGPCDSRNYTFTEQCTVEDTTDDQGKEGCKVSMNECGCLWWDEGDDSDSVAALHSKSCTDPCAVHGYDPLPSSARSVYGMTASFGVAAMSIAWYVL